MIISRFACDDFTALHTAQGMENAGANVFSLVSNGESASRYIGCRPIQKFIVFAKCDCPVTPDQIDEEITKALK